MAKRRNGVSRARKSDYPPFVWMLFGLAIGLSVAFAVYVNSRQPVPIARNDDASASQPAERAR